MTNIGEQNFYKKIKNDCTTIFDIGCREDTYYLENGVNKIFYLFEPNVITYNNCRNKIDSLIDNKKITNNRIYLYNFGLGNKTIFREYYLETQSFFVRKNLISKDAKPVKLSLRRFSEFLEENDIDKIDFLKIDTEGFEPEILLDNIDFVKNNVKYVQFEWANTWYDKTEPILFSKIYNTYVDDFTFHFVYDHGHPFGYSSMDLLTPIVEQDDYEKFNSWVNQEYGANIAMMSRSKVK